MANDLWHHVKMQFNKSPIQELGDTSQLLPKHLLVNARKFTSIEADQNILNAVKSLYSHSNNSQQRMFPVGMGSSSSPVWGYSSFPMTTSTVWHV